MSTNSPMKLRNGKNVICKTMVVKNTADGNARSTWSIPPSVSSALPVCSHMSTSTMKMAPAAMTISEFSASSTICPFRLSSLEL